MKNLDPRRAVVLFTGDTRGEERRKRLPARFLGRLHRSLRGILERVAAADLFIASDHGGNFHIESAHAAASCKASNLASRVETAFAHTFAFGYDAVIVVAGDVAGLTSDAIERAFASLERGETDCVIGPSGDGGFYLAGFRRYPSLDWSALPWFSSDAARALSAEAERRSCTVELLDRLDDIDCVADALRSARALPVPFTALKRALLSLLQRREPLPRPDSRAPSRARLCATRLRAPPAA